MNEANSENRSPGADSEDFAAHRDDQITRFVKTSPAYYQRQFAEIGSDSKFVWTWNLWAAVLGSVWFAARGMWNWALSFLIIETIRNCANCTRFFR